MLSAYSHMLAYYLLSLQCKLLIKFFFLENLEIRGYNLLYCQIHMKLFIMIDKINHCKDKLNTNNLND